jgi:hypothetical protein
VVTILTSAPAEINKNKQEQTRQKQQKNKKIFLLPFQPN